MDERYAEWIAKNVADPLGTCAEVTERMAAVFPDLKRVRGHYYCTAWGERAHWWLVTDAGDIVDPTAAQFPSRGHGHYEPWNEGDEEPTGKCANCGEYTYGSAYTCSDDCHAAMVSEFASHGVVLR